MAYTYRFAYLLGDQDFAEIELSNVKFDRRIIMPGTFSGTIAVTNALTAEQARKVIPGMTVVHVYNDTEIWGTYIIWQKRVRSSSAGGTTVDIQGATLESWLYRRIIDVDMTFSGVDQISILESLLDQAQTGWEPYAPSANLNIVMTSGASGILRAREYKKTEATSVGQRIEELANVDNGFEYIIKTYINSDTDTRVRELEWGYPELNSNLEPSQFFYPGNISSYEILYDATEAGTAFWARGDSIEEDPTTDPEPLMTETPQLADEYLGQGWPHLDKVVDYSSVTTLDTLEDYATWWRDNYAGLVVIPQIEVNNSDKTCTFSPNQLGSYSIFTITDEYFPLNRNVPTFSGSFRVVGMEVSPGERGRQETIRLVVATDFDPTEV